MKEAPLMEKIRKEVEYFKRQNKRDFEGLAGQRYIRRFLGSPFVDDFVFVLRSFGFEIKKPEGLPIGHRISKPKKVRDWPSRRREISDILNETYYKGKRYYDSFRDLRPRRPRHEKWRYIGESVTTESPI